MKIFCVGLCLVFVLTTAGFTNDVPIIKVDVRKDVTVVESNLGTVMVAVVVFRLANGDVYEYNWNNDGKDLKTSLTRRAKNIQIKDKKKK